MEQSIEKRFPFPSNCHEAVKEHGHRGVYYINMPEVNLKPFEVNCVNYNGSIWTVILRHSDGSVNFNRNWTEYKSRFGDVHGEFFIGLDKLHVLTSESYKHNKLHIPLRNFEKVAKYAACDFFAVANEIKEYKLNVKNCSGSAPSNSLIYHDGEMFTTFDHYHSNPVLGNCAKQFKAAYWYRKCVETLLTGQYFKNDHINDDLHKSKIGIYWYRYETNAENMEFAEMIISII